MELSVLIIFGLVYLGMLLGKLPGLALDRTGVALLGAIAIVAFSSVPIERAWAAVDMPTLFLLFGMMVISAQFRLAGFYTHVVQRLVYANASPKRLLALVIGVVGVLSAVLTNDVVCLALTPILIEGCARRKLNPLPFLLGLACASNIGSAATLIGNPQNILIGQALKLSFSSYLWSASIPSVLGLVFTWLIISHQFRGKWEGHLDVPPIETPAYNRLQSWKGGLVTAALVISFLFFHELPHDGVALICAGILLLSRRMASKEMMALVDWQLLILFAGLFIVNDAFQQTGAMAQLVQLLQSRGIQIAEPASLFGFSVILSNLVSNVPAVMLLLPSAQHPLAGSILGLASTFAGNLVLVGSIANLIVVNSARSLGVEINFRTHFKTGLPVTLATLTLAAAWLLLLSVL